MKTNAGSYVVRGSKKAMHYLNHHFGAYFRLWIMGIVATISQVFGLGAIFQRQAHALCHMVDEADEIIMPKTFDGTDKRSAFFSLFLFDVIVNLFTLVILAVIAGLFVLVYSCIIFIYQYSVRAEEVDIIAVNAMKDSCLYLLIPFGLAALVTLIYSLMVFQVGSHVASKNASLGLGDLLMNTLQILKKRGWKLFAMNLLYFLELAFYAGFVVALFYLVPMLIGKGDPTDTALPLFVFWIMIPVISVLTFFILPMMGSSFLMSTYYLLEDFGTSDHLVVAFRKKTDDETNAYVTLSPVEDEGETKELPLKPAEKLMTDETKEGE